MEYIDFEIDGKIVKVRNEDIDNETDALEEESEFDKTKEIKIIDDPYVDDNTVIDLFGDKNE